MPGDENNRPNPDPPLLNDTGDCKGWAESDLEHLAHLKRAGSDASA
jgi:hypothetical protein